ncbi:MAG: hypothetical protein M5U34_38395 [Chloroflexi bacterium]|nr:hypothetical protein [Chloroflexota bacterium]
MKPNLTINNLCLEAKIFSEIESSYFETNLHGVTDGKAIGIYLEHKFQKFLHDKYVYTEGNSASGIDNHANIDDIVAFYLSGICQLTKPQIIQLAQEILNNRPHLGYLTISNALQWRLQYRRVIEVAGEVEGIRKVI